MLAVFLTSLGTFFQEISNTIGKTQANGGRESPYSLGFLDVFGATLVFAGMAVFIPGSFVFSLASIPFVVLRLVLGIAQAHATVFGMVLASRSTFGFLRTITIPLLLGMDFLLGYFVSMRQYAGVVIIVAVLIFLFINHGLSRKGSGLVLFSAVNAVILISLYKHIITYYNSVVAEQLITHVFLLVYFFIAAKIFAGENPFLMLRKRVFFIQSFTQGFGGVLESFAYLFAPASIIIAATRASSIIWSVISGHIYFHEKGLIVKILGMIFLILGLYLLL